MDAAMGSNEPADVVVVGAGLAGLTAAAVAAGSPGNGPGRRRVVLVDVRSDEHTFGGRARTDQRDGFALNQGPRALYRGGQARAVLERLGLHPQGGTPPTADSYGWRDGRVERLPGDSRHLMTNRLLSPRSKGQVAWLLGRLGRIQTAELGDQNMAAWIADLGLRPDAEGLVTMITRVATYTADLTQLSADAGVRQVQLAMGEGVEYLDGGWQQLVDGLFGVTRARGVQVRPGARLLSVAASGSEPGWTLDLGPAGRLRAATVILALGSPSATRAVLADPLTWSLGPDVTAACLDLGLRRAPERAIVFGIDQPVYLSTHTPSARLAPDGQAVVHVMRYGARDATRDSAQLWELAHLAGIERGDVVVDRFLHRMVVAHALPRPGSGLTGRPPVEVAGHPGVFVAGDWVGGEGMLADASLASAERAAAGAVRYLDHRPQLAGSAR